MIDSFGISVIGPLHKDQGLPNQDAWASRRGQFGSAIVVCDGVGSKPHAAHGSRMACLAALDAIRKWCHAHGAPHKYLSHLVEVFWRIRIFPHEPSECATTCLIALRRPNGRWLIGGIGDGMAVTFAEKEEIQWVIGESRQAFSNQVGAMGFDRSFQRWHFEEFDEGTTGRTVVLTTDGLSDDVIPKKTLEFCQWLLALRKTEGRRTLPRRLRHELLNWPTPNHCDDKTLAVISSDGSNEGELCR